MSIVNAKSRRVRSLEHERAHVLPCYRHGSLLVAAALVMTGGAAQATPEFPEVVVRTLGLPGVTVDAPQGCTLCHTTDSGGTALRPFGVLVQDDGARPYEDATLEAALGQIGQDNPQLVEDIQAGRDPNDDTGSDARPTPRYGCSIARPVRGGWAPWAASLAVIAAMLRRLRTARGAARRRRRGAATASA
jgi:hypothetical protein